VTPVPADPPPRRVPPALRGWLRSVGFTLALSLLVAAGVAGGGQVSPAVVLIAAGLGLGVLYSLFPHGMHFAFGTANGFAVYACLYVFMGRAGFPDAAPWAKAVGFLLPIAAFLAAIWARRSALRALAEGRRPLDTAHLPRMMRFILALAAIGVVSMVVPEGRIPGPAQTVSLLVAMTAIAVVVAASVRDVVRLLVDVALIFETIGGRLGHLAVPITAFVTVYALLVITFASCYRVADGLSAAPVFASAAGPFRLDFADALHFSVATLSTVGYGDIRPVGDGVRVLASLQVLLGQLLLLFGFAEIMRSTRLRAREDGGEAAGPSGGAPPRPSRGNHVGKPAEGGEGGAASAGRRRASAGEGA
jgi:hypothetical protein